MSTGAGGTMKLQPLFEKLWPEIRVRHIGNVGDIQIFTVHGEIIRNKVWLDYTEGGNTSAYRWMKTKDIPQMITIDADATQGEQELTKLHELTEYNAMTDKGIDYDTAHSKHANVAEQAARDDPKQYGKLWQEQVNIALQHQGQPPMNAPQPGKNDLIAAAEQKIESQLKPNVARDYRKIVTAGMAMALKGGPNSILAKLKDSKNPVHDAAVGAVNLCLLMRKQSRGTMPLKAMVPAATVLSLKAIEFAEQARMIQIDEHTVVNTTKILVDHLLRAFGLTPQRLHVAAQKIHQMTQDPATMEKIHHAAGMAVAPGAVVAPQPEGNA